MKVLIGTTNPGKIKGAELALKHYYQDVEIEGIKVDSNVPEQPVNEDVYLGAKNRVDNLIKYAQDNGLQADMYMAIEAGLSNGLGKWCNYNIAVVRDDMGHESVGVGPGFPIPDRYLDKIINTSLGEVFDNIYHGNKLNLGKGGISSLTHNGIDRIEITRQAFIMALTTFVNDFWRDF